MTGGRPRYALVDLIRDGLTPAELRAGGDRAVYNALFKTAASAMQRGQPEQEWAALVSEPRSRLGQQARLKGGRKERTARDYHRTLHGAWDAAAKWLATRPPPASPHDVDRLAGDVLTFAADPGAPLPDEWRAVLVHAATFARGTPTRTPTTRPALSRRGVAEATGLTERTARRTLDELDRAGLLVLAVRGHSGKDEGTRKANLYRLPDTDALAAYLCRGTRPMGQQAQTYGTAANPEVGTPPQTYGTPPLVIEPKGESVLTITGRPEDIAAFIDALPLSARQLVQPPTADETTRDVGRRNVVPIRRAETARKPA